MVAGNGATVIFQDIYRLVVEGLRFVDMRPSIERDPGRNGCGISALARRNGSGAGILREHWRAIQQENPGAEEEDGFHKLQTEMPSGGERRGTSNHLLGGVHHDNRRLTIRPAVYFSMKDFGPPLEVARAFDLHGEEAAAVGSNDERDDRR